MKNQYSLNLVSCERRVARVVSIGEVPLGGNNPIRIQSMTNTNTMDTISTVEQSIRLIDAGCEYVRITAPSINEANNLVNIKAELQKRGYKIPLIADIHHTPKAAEVAARIVAKVRINPGNYADKKKLRNAGYSDVDYKHELERINKRFSPLIKICKEYGTAIRIGVNHGSLSERIMSRYGDTSDGMVESALEFVRFCEDQNFSDLVLSMKSSNPLVMVQANRLLVHRMDLEDMTYPLHLGVTEAGEGEDGRIKSAVGIGTLLEDGIGDTIRVSLTEAPEKEIPVAKKLIQKYSTKSPLTKGEKRSSEKHRNNISPINPFEYSKRITDQVLSIGEKQVPRVILDISQIQVTQDVLRQFGFKYDSIKGNWIAEDIAPDFIYLDSNKIDCDFPENLKFIYDYNHWRILENSRTTYPLLSWDELQIIDQLPEKSYFVLTSTDQLEIEQLRQLKNVILVLTPDVGNRMTAIRTAIFKLIENQINIPVIAKIDYRNLDGEKILLHSAIDLGGLLVDGLIDGVWINPGNKFTLRTAFGILQSTRSRITKTEYISCPSCGRTQFDLEQVSAEIRKRTGHLKGLKIGIMGCIVNGPGEMADADYGYVGAGAGKITLYRNKIVITKNLPFEEAVSALIDLIKKDGKWNEPKG